MFQKNHTTQTVKTLTLSVCLSSLLLADITGVVYKDFDLNGEKNGGDAGISGVTVTAVCNDGNSTTTTTNEDGNYTLSGFSEGALCRVEADPSSAGVGSGPNAKGSAPLVDIVTDGSTHDISTGSPATYCQPNPDVIMAALPGYYTDEKYDTGGGESPGNLGTIYKVPAPANGEYNANDTIKDKRITLAKAEDTGAVWGAAWQKSTKTLFVSAALKRYVPLQKETTSDEAQKSAGAIYKIDTTTEPATVSRFLEVEEVLSSEAADNLSHRDYSYDEDKDVIKYTGRMGLGDLEMSEDETTLYTINMLKKQLVIIDIATQDVQTVDIPNPYGDDVCDASMVRPWALKVRGDEVFIGSVCEDKIEDDLGAAIQKYDGSTIKKVAQTNSLQYLRARDYKPKDQDEGDGNRYENWTYDLADGPILSDIEFNNEGDLVLGYNSRSTFNRSWGLRGDIRKMCLNEDGTYTDEATDINPDTGCGLRIINYEGNPTDYYGFYIGDFYGDNHGESGHPETASGALAQAPGAANIIVGMIDATDWYQPGAIGNYDNETGDKIGAQAVIDNQKMEDGGEREAYGSKAGGMGDVELLCDPAPIEVGNYVWMDLDEDGIQDAGEPAFKDVNVTLSCNDDEYGVATTDKSGHYYFGGIDNVNLKDGKVIVPGLECELSLKQEDVNDKEASTDNPNEDANDTIDNDAVADNDAGTNKITFTTTVSNDHTLDFGILSAKGCVSGTLFEDVNGDGLFNSTDTAAPAHISLNVKDAYGNTYTTETDENGEFTLENILAGDITLSVDTSDTDIPDGSVWSDPGSSVTITLSEGSSADDTCSDKDFPYTIPGEKDRDPKDVAVCANPTSITWEGSNVSSATVWHDLLDGDLTDVETVSGNTVTVSMHIDNPDNQFYDTDTDNDSGSGTSAAFGEPYLTLYLGSQDVNGTGTWDDANACDENGYKLLSGQKAVLTVDFNESVVLDNWRIRDVDSGNKRGDDHGWEWQDAIEVIAYDENNNEVAIETKIGDSGAGLIQDNQGIVHTDKENYDAGEGDFINGAGTTPNATNGHIVLTSNFVPIKQLVITHSAGPDAPCQTRSALAMTGLAVCKPLHISGTIYDDKDGTDQADCDTDDDINGEPISEIDGKALNACLLDDDGLILDTQVIGEDGSYDFFTGIHPNTTYGMLLTTDECIVGNEASSAKLSEGWNYEGETYTTSPDGDLDGYVDVLVEEKDVTKIDFAINKTPTALGYDRASELNPGEEVQVQFDESGTASSEYISDYEETTPSITIKTISNGTLYYDDEEKSAGDTIDEVDFSKFYVDPKDGDVIASFTYVAVDKACRESEVAIFNAPFTTLEISGNLFLDKERDNTVNGTKTPYSCDNETALYVNLIGEDNSVLSSKALDEDGSYVFRNEDGIEADTNYTIVLSTTQDGETVLPEGCAYADGENIGTDAGTDGDADGNISVKVEQENVENINFSITPLVKIGDQVWIEDDNDGNASTGNITPVKDANVTATCGDEEYSAQTNDDGIYEIVVPINIGECTLTVATPDGTVPAKGSDDNSVDDNTTENDLTHDGSGTTVTVEESDNLTLDFGFVNVASLGDRVWYDNNRDGIQQDDEDGVSDVKVTLNDSDGNEVATATTDENGNYTFSDLEPGDYSVSFDTTTLPEGYVVTPQNAGDDDSVDSDADENGKTEVTTLDAGENDTTWDMGINLAEGSLSGNVSADTNNDSEGDRPLEGVTLILLDSEGNEVARTTTDENGDYGFSNIQDGNYSVVEEQPAGYFDVKENEGGEDNDRADNNEVNKIDVVVEAGEVDTHNDFVEVEEASLGDRVWFDSNANGVQDTDEAGVENVTVYLLDSDGNRVAQTTTNTEGDYRFEHLNPLVGYVVKFDLNTLPEGYEVTTQNSSSEEADSDAQTTGETDEITLVAGEYTPDIDMGIHRVGATEETPYYIGTHFWVDSNKNGLFDADEQGIEGARIELYDAEGNKLYWTDETKTTLTTEVTAFPAEEITDANGEYHFYVAAGEYSVHFNMPSSYANEYVFDTQAQNDDDTQNINAANNEGMTLSVVVGEGQKVEDLTLDAGIYCSCEDAPIQSNGGNALGMLSTLMMMFLTLLGGSYFIRKDETEQGA